jgi:hypothetical protein
VAWAFDSFQLTEPTISGVFGDSDRNQSRALTRIGGRECYFNVKTTFWSRANLDGCVVSVGDGADDRQAEADPLPIASSIGAEPLKGFEKKLDHRRRHHWSCIGHRQDCFSVTSLGADVQSPIDDVVSKGVVNEVGDQPFDQYWIPIRTRCR